MPSAGAGEFASDCNRATPLETDPGGQRPAAHWSWPDAVRDGITATMVPSPEQPRRWVEYRHKVGMDCTRELHPKQRMYTYWVSDDALAQDKGFRPDFLRRAPTKVTCCGC